MKVPYLAVYLLLTFWLISGCSGTYQSYYQTLKLATAPPSNITLNIEQITQSKSDLVSVKRGTRGSSVMALAFLENGRHKWVSADNTIIVTDKGRIISTQGLDFDLLYTTNLQQDPFKKMPTSTLTTWDRYLDWANDEYGILVNSRILSSEASVVNYLDKRIEAMKVTERVEYKANSGFINLDRDWQNVFWYSKKSGKLIKSIQKLSPKSEAFEMTFLSRISREH